jgi:hypothetical protein
MQGRSPRHLQQFARFYNHILERECNTIDRSDWKTLRARYATQLFGSLNSDRFKLGIRAQKAEGMLSMEGVAERGDHARR